MFQLFRTATLLERRSSGWLLSLSLIAAFLLCGPALAEPHSLGGMRFEAPDGWSAKVTTDGLILQRAFPNDARNNRKGAALIQIMTPAEAPPGSFDAAFERIAATVTDLGRKRPMRRSNGVTVNGHRIRTDYRCCASSRGVTIGQRTVGIATSNSQAFLALVTLGLRGEAAELAERDFAALIRSIRLEAKDRPFELVPDGDNEGLDGVFTALDAGLRPNVFGGVDFFSESRITVFDPSGLYSRELPGGGDIKAHCRQTPTVCGLYRVNGGGLFSGARTIEMRAVADEFGTIEVKTEPLKQADDSLFIGDRKHQRLPPFAPGTRFVGTWDHFSASSGTGGLSSGSVAVKRTITLDRDGRFQRTGWSGGTSTSDVGGSTAGITTSANRPAETGRYDVEGFTLVLVGADGRTERLTLFAPETGSDKLLVIDGANYLKKN